MPIPPLPVPPTSTAAPGIDLEAPTTNNGPLAQPGPSGISNAQPGPTGILENISIDELFQKLVASGIVPNIDNKGDNEEDTVKLVDFSKPETLKQCVFCIESITKNFENYLLTYRVILQEATGAY